MVDGDVRWLTYAEVQQALGLPSARAALQRSRRGNWPRRQHNEDKLVRVGVPASILERSRSSYARSLEPGRDTEREVTKEITLSVTPSVDSAHTARLDAAEARVTEALSLAREIVGQLEQAHQGRTEALARVAALEAAGAALRDALEREQTQRDEDRMARLAAEAEREAARAAAEAAQANRDAMAAELASWAAGGPLARAWRAFWARGRA